MAAPSGSFDGDSSPEAVVRDAFADLALEVRGAFSVTGRVAGAVVESSSGEEDGVLRFAMKSRKEQSNEVCGGP
jgi:hypothetical protein